MFMLYKENYQGWTYIYDRSQFSLDFPEKGNAPHRFYKYYGLSERSIDALTGCYVYATHPNQFNDALDCCKGLFNFKTASEQDLQSLYGPYFYDFLKTVGDIESLRTFTNENYKTLLYRHCGICSLTTRRNNVTLWAYYTNNEGFCVEFDTKLFPFIHYGPFPVHYVKELLPINIDRNIALASFIQSTVKAESWRNEEEWRLLISNPSGFDFILFNEQGCEEERYKIMDEHDRKMRYPVSAIKSVTLSERFLNNSKVCFARISRNEFEIVLLNEQDMLRKKVLDFLFDVSIPTSVITIDKEKNRLSFLQGNLIRLSERKYRLMVTKTTTE